MNCALAMFVAACLPGGNVDSTPPDVDVVVYGGTPAGIAAAVAAGKRGQNVLLIEPYRWIGGLTTNGLSHPDFRTFEGLNGFYLDFTRRVHSYYVETYGPDSPQVRDTLQGTHAEPHVNQAVFEEMLAEHESIDVLTRLRLSGVETAADAGVRRILSISVTGPDGAERQLTARAFIDASYEGDLMAAAGVEYRFGREARDACLEPLAPESADTQVQGYNFRLIMTRDPQVRVSPERPDGYDRDDYLPLVELLEAGRFESVFCYPSGGLYKAHTPVLPNGKYDVNDVSRGLVRLSLPDVNDAWPDADLETRRAIFAEHVRHNVGMLYFLQNDDSVPAAFQREAREWGMCRDEFVENGHVPEQLYIREARRMRGRHIFTERDTDCAPGDARAVLHRDAIAMGDYGPNCHGTAHEGPRFGGRHTGEFYKRVAPYQIPYGVIVTRDVDNLLVPVACSASHVGFCALRLEPIWSSLGQASGAAASLALEGNLAVWDVPVARLQRELHASGAATIYISDVAHDSPDFAAVQWWGTQGGLHGLYETPDEPGQRGANIIGQYYEAFPYHAAELDKPLEPKLTLRWRVLAESLHVDVTRLDECRTRGEFIRTAFDNVRRL